MKNNYILLGIILIFTKICYSQVGIGTSTPNGALDVNSSLPLPSTHKSGLLPPIVALTATNSFATTTVGSDVINPNGGGNPITGTIVYNTNTSATGANQVTPGYYFYNGTVWEKITSGATTNWSLTGNSGTTAATNFIGTSDAVDLSIRSTNIERLRVLADGRVSINTATPNAGDQFTSVSTTSAINGYTSTGFGVYGQSTGNNSVAVYGITNNATANGVIASNINATGTGSLSIGNNTTGYTVTGGSGAANNGTVYGTISYGNDATGWGIAAAGNNLSTVSIAGGGGGSFTGRRWGVFANATINGNNANEATDRAAFVGSFNQASPALATTVYLGARIGSVNYKVLGTGSSSVSTTMPTRDGERILFAPEAPENWFFDIGEVTLVNGKAIVTIDPIFVDCIADSKPFKVFVQGGENTLGSIRITRNQEAKTFTVEDLGGESNGIVQYSIYGIWKQKENLRFPKYTQPFDLQEHKKELAKQTQIMK
jgi:hypothetical protein